MSKIVSALAVVTVIALFLILGGTLITVTGSQPEASPAAVSGPGTAFTYQGYLTQSETPANGSFDLAFALYDDPEGGSQISSTISHTLTITDGLFTVELDFGSVFDGTPLWLEVGVRPAGDTDPATSLLPRQRLTPVPFSAFANVAASAPWAGLTDVPAGFADGLDDDTAYLAGTGLDLDVTTFAISSTYQLPQSCSTSQTIKWNGSAWACGTDEVGAGGSAWSLTGNTGTVAGTNFLGTTDDQALEFRVNQSHALRLEPRVASPNLIAGYGGNSVDAPTAGATIGGGGRDLAINQAHGSYSTVDGGAGNSAGGYASAVGGGEGNSAAGNYSLTAGGASNSASGPYAAIGGGQTNTVTGTHATVAGGGFNEARTAFTAVGGGASNVVSGTFGTIAGGQDNVLTSTHATISGGANNEVTGAYASVGGGSYNSVTAAYGTIAGGGPEDTGNPTTSNNQVDGDYGTVGGGGGNTAEGFSATVAGGTGNTAGNGYATVGGGGTNAAAGYAATVGGGSANSATGNYATVAGGSSNQVAVTSGTIPGGADNYVSGPYGFAAGREAHAEHPGAFVWSDSIGGLASTARDQFLIDASGGVGIGTASPTQALTVQGSGLFLGGDEPVARGYYTSSWRLLDAPSAVYATGSEAYVTSYSTNTLTIFNVSDPEKIEYIGHSTSNLSGPSDLFISGQRAYVTSQLNHRLVVFDVSDPSAPDSLGSTDESLSNPMALYVRGKYAYVASNGTDVIQGGLAVFDTSEARHIRLVDFVSTNLLKPNNLYVVGNYAYVTDGTLNRLAIFDISDPRPGQIVPLGFATSPLAGPRAVFVSGSYAYVVAETSPGGLVIFDVSDPSAIAVVGSTSANLNAPQDIFVAGEWAYVASSGNDRLAVFDVSDPANIVARGFADMGENSKPVSLFVAGKHVYVASETANKLSIYDVNHLESPALQTGNLQTAYLDVMDNAAINNDLAVHGGLQVGPGGALIGGAMSVTGQDDSHILGALSVGGAGALISDTIIMTRTQWMTAPTHALDVIGEGRFRVNDYHNLVLRSPNAGSDEDAYIDLVRSDQTTVMTPTARIEFDAADPFTHTTSIHFHTQGPGDPATVSRFQISAEGHLLPDLDGYYTLGDENHQWSSVYAQGGIVTTSDGRYKENVQALPYGLDEVNALRPVTFNWTRGADDGLHYGLIAQEVRDVLPDIVTGDEGPDGTLGLNYSELVPVLIRAVQEQQEQIDTQAEQIAALEARLTALEDGQPTRTGSLPPFTTLGFGGLALGAVAVAGFRRRGRRA
jgi:hypothetical protein